MGEHAFTGDNGGSRDFVEIAPTLQSVKSKRSAVKNFLSGPSAPPVKSSFTFSRLLCLFAAKISACSAYSAVDHFSLPIPEIRATRGQKFPLRSLRPSCKVPLGDLTAKNARTAKNQRPRIFQIEIPLSSLRSLRLTTRFSAYPAYSAVNPRSKIVSLCSPLAPVKSSFTFSRFLRLFAAKISARSVVKTSLKNRLFCTFIPLADNPKICDVLCFYKTGHFGGLTTPKSYAIVAAVRIQLSSVWGQLCR